jgi:hypothetical protein
MPMIDPSPSADELKSLAALFMRVEGLLKAYLQTNEGKQDANFLQLSAAAISLNNAADTIAVMQLQLAVDQGMEAVAVINKATAELQKALILRQKITHVLGIVQSVVAFGAAIASDDVGSIISSGRTLFSTLTTDPGTTGATAGAAV